MDFHNSSSSPSSSIYNGKAIIQEDHTGTLANVWCNNSDEVFGRKMADFKGSENPRMKNSPSKRQRGSQLNSQISRCQVEGCNIDLTSAKDYHRRHRICECHSKSPKVIVAGFEKRFCQQCSRFHNLVEFDEMKRSCRRRLSDHNARRRRPHPEAIHMRSAGFTSSLYERRPSNFLVNRLASSLATTTSWESSCSSKMTQAGSNLMRGPGNGSSSSSNSYLNEAQQFPGALSLLSSSSSTWELNQPKSSSVHDPIFMHQNTTIGQTAINPLESQNWPLYSPQEHVSAEQAHSMSPL